MSSWGIALALALWAMTAGAAENTRCRSVDAWRCEAAGCRPTAGMEWTIIPGVGEIWRCNAAECRNLPYDKWIVSDGRNRYAIRGGSETLTVNQDGSFVHVATGGETAMVSFGHCAVAP